jgi:hypothetical protein
MILANDWMILQNRFDTLPVPINVAVLDPPTILVDIEKYQKEVIEWMGSTISR